MSDLGELLTAIEAAGTPEDPTAVAFLARQLAVSPELETTSGPTALRAARALAVHGPSQALPKAAELAAKAHQASVPGAGALFAECVDRMNLMSGRPQRFGTIVTKHQDDLILAPVDGTVDDETYRQLGVPTLDDRRASVQRRNETVARERATAGGLAPGQRFCRVWRDPSPTELKAKLAEFPEGVWADGDELTFACRSPAAYGLIAGPVFELPMWKVGDTNVSTGESLWALTVRVERLSEAVIGYGFWELDESGGLAGGGLRGPVDHRFRGPDAPAQLDSTPDNQIAGTIVTEALSSTALRENRLVTVYIPPGHEPAETLPVIYATDGNGMGPYIRRIDTAINGGNIPRFVLVAAYAAPMSAYSNERSLEYLPGFDDKRFDRHQQFFVHELAQWAQENFGVSEDREQRAVFGCSDGGGHALATGHMNRERFGHCIAYSTGLPPNEQMGWEADKAPFVHLCAGTLEGAFHQATHAWAAWLHFAKSPHHWTERVCGHDLIQWIEELPRAVARAWG